MPNKIQFKRGLKASLPDLDAGEPGYCTDTQELFIGNSAGPNMRVPSSADLAISPDDYSGTDAQKVQAAINYAITNLKAIRFSRIYDITGSTITLNKPTTDRTVLYLIGAGGGIKKTDAGYVFTGSSVDMGDIYSSNMKYESVSYAGTKVWDCNKLIRIFSVGDDYKKVDTVAEASTRWMQSCKFINCTMTGSGGWVFEWAQSFDCLIEGNTIEEGTNGIRNTAFIGNPDNNTLRIINNVIEGMGGIGISLGSSLGCTISGNYQEANTEGYMNLNASADFHNGLIINGNTFQQTAAQITAAMPAIKLGKMGNNGVSSAGNVASGHLYETVNAGSSGILTSVSDISYSGSKVIGDTALLSELGKVTAVTSGINYGRVYTYNKLSTNTSFTAGQTIELLVSFAGITTLTGEDLASVTYVAGSGNTSITVLYSMIDIANNQVIVRVKNESSGSQNIQVKVVVMQIK